ncbi:MAG TPA: hypothetical protein PK156_05005 [Polyangium sp.]|nr:hypothetical protein [Polyangium sp.]
MDVYLRDKRVRISPASSIGKGGEADIFDLGSGVALKLWKGPEHPDVKGLPEEEQAAAQRLALVQDKMKAFPRRLPDRVVCPIDVVTDKKNSTILGYTMRLVAGAESLMSLSEPSRRRALGGNAMSAILVDLWRTVAAIHSANVVLGDFNDLNVLVRENEAHIVDADSFQFGAYPCPVFTERFLDPLICDPTAIRPVPLRPFSAESDWYAFAVMVMTALLCVGPYGGVYRPKEPSKRLQECLRPLRRVTVFNPDVRYPKPAIPYRVLPDDFLHVFSQIFERDLRTPFPFRLLEGLRFTNCLACGAEHARTRCPACDHGVVRECVVVRGQVKATRKFSTSGTILAATWNGSALEYIVHENASYRREDGTTILKGPRDGRVRFFLQGKTTCVARGSRVVVMDDGRISEEINVDMHAGEPAFVLNERHAFYVQGGRLWRRILGRSSNNVAGLASQTADLWGDVLAGQTRIWVGSKIGFGYYRAGNVSVAFTFDTEKRGIGDSVRLSWPNGQIIKAHAVIDDDKIWFLMAFVIAGRIVHRAVVLGADGSVLGTADASAGDGSWLGTLSGHRAIGGVLFAPTDTGIVRVEVGPDGPYEVKKFVDTEPFVQAGAFLFVGREGIFAVEPSEITLLAMG